MNHRKRSMMQHKIALSTQTKIVIAAAKKRKHVQDNEEAQKSITVIFFQPTTLPGKSVLKNYHLIKSTTAEAVQI